MPHLRSIPCATQSSPLGMATGLSIKTSAPLSPKHSFQRDHESREKQDQPLAAVAELASELLWQEFLCATVLSFLCTGDALQAVQQAFDEQPLQIYEQFVELATSLLPRAPMEVRRPAFTMTVDAREEAAHGVHTPADQHDKAESVVQVKLHEQPQQLRRLLWQLARSMDAQGRGCVTWPDVATAFVCRASIIQGHVQAADVVPYVRAPPASKSQLRAAMSAQLHTATLDLPAAPPTAPSSVLQAARAATRRRALAQRALAKATSLAGAVSATRLSATSTAAEHELRLAEVSQEAQGAIEDAMAMKHRRLRDVLASHAKPADPLQSGERHVSDRDWYTYSGALAKEYHDASTARAHARSAEAALAGSSKPSSAARLSRLYGNHPTGMAGLAARTAAAQAPVPAAPEVEGASHRNVLEKLQYLPPPLDMLGIIESKVPGVTLLDATSLLPVAHLGGGAGQAAGQASPNHAASSRPSLDQGGERYIEAMEMFTPVLGRTRRPLLATAAANATVTLWDAGVQSRLHGRRIVPVLAWQTPSPQLALRWLPVFNVLLGGGHDGVVRLYDVGHGKLQSQAALHTDCITDALFINHLSAAATASLDATVALLDVAASAELHRLRGHSRGVTSLGFSESRRLLVTGSYDHDVGVYSPVAPARLFTLRGHGAPVIGVHAHGNEVVSAAADGVLKLWDLRAPGTPVQSILGDPGPEVAVLAARRRAEYRAKIFSRGSSAAGDDSGTSSDSDMDLALYQRGADSDEEHDAASSVAAEALAGQRRMRQGLQLRGFAACLPHRAELFMAFKFPQRFTRPGQLTSTMPGMPAPAAPAPGAVSAVMPPTPNQRTAVLTRRAELLASMQPPLWRGENTETLQPAHTEQAAGACLLAVGNHSAVAVTCTGKGMCTWSCLRGAPDGWFPDVTPARILCAAISPTEDAVAVGCADGTVLVLALASGGILRSLPKHAGEVRCVRWLGAAILSAGSDCALVLHEHATPLDTAAATAARSRVWSRQVSMRPTMPAHFMQGFVPEHLGSISCIETAPQHKCVLSGDDAGRVLVWSTVSHRATGEMRLAGSVYAMVVLHPLALVLVADDTGSYTLWAFGENGLGIRLLAGWRHMPDAFDTASLADMPSAAKRGQRTFQAKFGEQLPSLLTRGPGGDSAAAALQAATRKAMALQRLRMRDAIAGAAAGSKAGQSVSGQTSSGSAHAVMAQHVVPVSLRWCAESGLAYAGDGDGQAVAWDLNATLHELTVSYATLKNLCSGPPPEDELELPPGLRSRWAQKAAVRSMRRAALRTGVLSSPASTAIDTSGTAGVSSQAHSRQFSFGSTDVISTHEVLMRRQRQAKARRRRIGRAMLSALRTLRARQPVLWSGLTAQQRYPPVVAAMFITVAWQAQVSRSGVADMSMLQLPNVQPMLVVADNSARVVGFDAWTGHTSGALARPLSLREALQHRPISKLWRASIDVSAARSVLLEHRHAAVASSTASRSNLQAMASPVPLPEDTSLPPSERMLREFALHSRKHRRRSTQECKEDRAEPQPAERSGLADAAPGASGLQVPSTLSLSRDRQSRVAGALAALKSQAADDRRASRLRSR